VDLAGQERQRGNRERYAVLARNRAQALAWNLAVLHDRTLALVREPEAYVAYGLAVTLGEAVRCSVAAEAVYGVDAEQLAAVVSLADDFTGADLRSADLTDAALIGVRWSDTTQWPAPDVDRIRRTSVAIGDGQYEIRPGTTAAGDDRTRAPR
jgi:hypothetical protein